MQARSFLTRVLLPAALGVIGVAVSFAAAAAFEVPGTTAAREIVGASLVACVYYGLCHFWLAKGRPGMPRPTPEWFTLLAPLALVGFVVAFGESPRAALPLVAWMIGAAAGSATAAAGAARLAPAGATGGTAATASGIRRGRRLIGLSAGALAVVVGFVSWQAIPAVVADATPGFNGGSVGIVLGVAAILALLVAAMLAGVVWRGRLADRHWSLAVPSILLLLLALLHAFASGVGAHGPALRSTAVLLALSSAVEAVSAGLIVVAAVMVRGRATRRPTHPAR